MRQAGAAVRFGISWRSVRSTALCAGTAIALLFVVGCAGNNADGSTPAAEGPPADVADLTEPPSIGSVLPEDRGEPPVSMIIDDIVAGDGREAAVGDTLTVHYVGVLWNSGTQFDASWDRGSPYQFTLGEGRVIEGWDAGMVGMRESGRRLLIIPPEMAYGDRGVSGLIGPDETLVFIVDLLAVDGAESS